MTDFDYCLIVEQGEPSPRATRRNGRRFAASGAPWPEARSGRLTGRSDRPASVGSPQGTGPRPGCSLARLNRYLNLLPTVALLLGALTLLAAAPVAAQTPAAPTNVYVDLARSGAFVVVWTQPTGTITGYDVHYTSAPATGGGSVSNTAAASGSDPATAWVADTGTDSQHPLHSTRRLQRISGLIDGTTYRLRVRGKNSNGAGAWAFGSGTPYPI